MMSNWFGICSRIQRNIGIVNVKNEKKHIRIIRNVNIFGKYPPKKRPYDNFASVCKTAIGACDSFIMCYNSLRKRAMALRKSLLYSSIGSSQYLTFLKP